MKYIFGGDLTTFLLLFYVGKARIFLMDKLRDFFTDLGSGDEKNK